MRIKHWVLLALTGCVVLLVYLALEPRKFPREPMAGRERDAEPQLPSNLAPDSSPPIARNDNSNDDHLRSDATREKPRATPDTRDDNGDNSIDPELWPEEVEPLKPAPRRPPLNPGMAPRAPGRAPLVPPAVRPPFMERNRRNRPRPFVSKLPKNIPAWFKEYDTNEDGMVALYEWRAKENDVREFRKYDLNGDGVITVTELIRSGQFITGSPAPPVLSGTGTEIGDFYYYEVTGSIQGVAFGTNVYTTDSVMAAVAVHAGIFRPGEKGFVKVTILPGEQHYHGSVSNGVTTHDRLEGYHKSFTIEAVR